MVIRTVKNTDNGRTEMFANISPNTSTVKLPFGSSEKTNITEPTTALPYKSKTKESDTITTEKPVRVTDRLRPKSPVPNFKKKNGMMQPEKMLPTDVDNISEVQTAEEFDLEIYSSVNVSSDVYDKLIKDAVDSVHTNSLGKRVKAPVIQTKTSFAVSTRYNSFTWMCTGFVFLQKVRDVNGEIYVDIQTTDDLGTTNYHIPIENFTRANLKELNKYGIFINPGFETTVSIYFHKVINSMEMKSAQQKLGFTLSKGEMKFSAYDDGTFTTSNTFGTNKSYIDALNGIIRDNPPIHYMLSATMSAATMTVLNLECHMKLSSYIINAVGGSSTGKTLVCKLCASAWTDPCSDKIFTSMLSTSNAMFRRLGGRFGVPMFLDEAKMTDNINTSEFGYTISEEREKYRLNPDCTEKVSGTWNTIIAMSSEEHFHADNKSQNGGLVVRIHNAECLNFTQSSKHADEIEDFISHNYGVLGRIFTDWLIEHKGILKKSFEKAKAYMRQITSNSPNEYTERLIKSYGLTILTSQILCNLGLAIDCDGVAEIMQKQNEVISTEYNMAENAITAIKDYVATHLYSAEIQPYRNAKNDKEITSVVIPESLTKKILDKAGFRDIKVTVKAIDKAGYLVRQGNGERNGLKSQLYINKVRTTCYKFKFSKTDDCEYEEAVSFYDQF